MISPAFTARATNSGDMLRSMTCKGMLTENDFIAFHGVVQLYAENLLPCLSSNNQEESFVSLPFGFALARLLFQFFGYANGQAR